MSAKSREKTCAIPQTVAACRHRAVKHLRLVSDQSRPAPESVLLLNSPERLEQNDLPEYDPLSKYYVPETGDYLIALGVDVPALGLAKHDQISAQLGIPRPGDLIVFSFCEENSKIPAVGIARFERREDGFLFACTGEYKHKVLPLSIAIATQVEFEEEPGRQVYALVRRQTEPAWCW